MIYTSYFAMANKLPGAISIYPEPPAWFAGDVAENLAADDDMFRKIKSYKISKQEFADYYLGEVLMQRDPEALLAEYDGKTLLGWSADDPYDCRFIFQQYMKYYVGDVVRELTKREIELGIRYD